MDSFGLFDALGELLETVDTAASVYEFLLARVERMALRTDFRMNNGISRSCDERVATDAGNLDFFVVGRVNTGFHREVERNTHNGVYHDDSKLTSLVIYRILGALCYGR